MGLKEGMVLYKFKCYQGLHVGEVYHLKPSLPPLSFSNRFRSPEFASRPLSSTLGVFPLLAIKMNLSCVPGLQGQV